MGVGERKRAVLTPILESALGVMGGLMDGKRTRAVHRAIRKCVGLMGGDLSHKKYRFYNAFLAYHFQR